MLNLMLNINSIQVRHKDLIMNITMIKDGLAMALFALACIHLPEIIVFLDTIINANLGE